MPAHINSEQQAPEVDGAGKKGKKRKQSQAKKDRKAKPKAKAKAKAGKAKKKSKKSKHANEPWADELRAAIDMSPKQNCCSFTVTGPNKGRVEVNKKGHFYVVTPLVTEEGRVVTWSKFPSIAAAWKAATDRAGF